MKYNKVKMINSPFVNTTRSRCWFIVLCNEELDQDFIIGYALTEKQADFICDWLASVDTVEVDMYIDDLYQGGSDD